MSFVACGWDFVAEVASPPECTSVVSWRTLLLILPQSLMLLAYILQVAITLRYRKSAHSLVRLLKICRLELTCGLKADIVVANLLLGHPHHDPAAAARRRGARPLELPGQPWTMLLQQSSLVCFCPTYVALSFGADGLLLRTLSAQSPITSPNRPFPKSASCSLVVRNWCVCAHHLELAQPG